MSKYIFIASDFEIPEVDLTNEQIITPIEAKLKGIAYKAWKIIRKGVKNSS